MICRQRWRKVRKTSNNIATAIFSFEISLPNGKACLRFCVMNHYSTRRILVILPDITQIVTQTHWAAFMEVSKPSGSRFYWILPNLTASSSKKYRAMLKHRYIGVLHLEDGDSWKPRILRKTPHEPLYNFANHYYFANVYDLRCRMCHRLSLSKNSNCSEAKCPRLVLQLLSVLNLAIRGVQVWVWGGGNSPI